jgi:UDP-2,3-diacylglucosamine pyrophosphatase LpxH
MTTRVCIPDSHGSMIDWKAAGAFLKDLKGLDADEIVMLGDHVDCSGLFTHHARGSQEDVEYSYYKDIAAANKFLDMVQRAAPRAKIHYLEGNHEGRVARWSAENITSPDDARMFVNDNAPEAKLRLRARGIRYYRQTEFYQGLAVPNTIRLGRTFYTHGFATGRHATAQHVDRFGANVVHGHTHRCQSYITRNIHSGVYGGWCPGTLMKLQPTYLHTAPSGWSHGYHIEFIARSGRFQAVPVAINNGVSLLSPLLTRLAA